jgi:hypothetical protein
MRNVLQLCALAALALAAVGCGGSGTLDNDEATVFLSISDIDYGGGSIVDVCGTTDMFVTALTITSNPKVTGAQLTASQDVTLTRWVVTPYRTDGGTATSPVWQRDADIYVPAGGEVTLADWNYYPHIFYDEPPLLYLHPENGGFDPETGHEVIYQSLRVEWFGQTRTGKKLSLSAVLDGEFYCSR